MLPALARALPLLLSAGLAGAAEAPASAAALRDQALASNSAYALVESLTTEVGPRMAGSPGDARAVAWAQRELKRLGFDRVWTEPVSIPHWTRRHERARVLGEFEQPLLITALGHSLSTGGPLQGEVVELADIDALRAVSDDRLRGKIVFLSHRMTRARDGAGYSKAADGRSDGPGEAARRGARALLLRSVGTDSHRLPHTGNTRRPADVHPIPAAALSNPDADQLLRLLRRGAPVQVELDIDVGFDGEIITHNVIGELRGREAPDEIVLIGAHLDSWDLGTGAIDDGAGIAITFAAGAQIAARPQRPRRSLRVVAFGAEEFGLLGAKAYAKDNAALMEQHVVGLESDFGAGRIYALQAGIAESGWSALQPLLAVLQPLGIEADRGTGSPGPDILPMWEVGVPWLSLDQDGSDYFDVHHTADDTLDKIDPAALDQQVAAYTAVAWTLADSAIDLRPAPAKPVSTTPDPCLQQGSRCVR